MGKSLKTEYDPKSSQIEFNLTSVTLKAVLNLVSSV